MTKAFVMAAALVALTLAMQEAANGEEAADPLAGLKTVRLKARPAKPAGEPQVAVRAHANPVQHGQPQRPEDLDMRPGITPGFLPTGSGTFTTGAPPPAPPPAAQQATQASQPSRHNSSPWSNMWWGFN